MANNFKSNTDYRFSESDWKFITQLSKVGYVHVLSNQVSLISETTGKTDSHHITFANYGSDEKKGCDGLVLPENWAIENIYASPSKLSILFKVSDRPIKADC